MDILGPETGPTPVAVKVIYFSDANAVYSSQRKVYYHTRVMQVCFL